MLNDVKISNEDWNFMTGDSDNQCEWVLGVSSAGHGGSICLLRDGNVIFFLKEERSSKIKRDCQVPFRCIKEIKKYTDEIDLILFLNIEDSKQDLLLNQLDKENIVYYETMDPEGQNHEDGICSYHHINHASCGYHLSPFCEEDDGEEVLIVVMDGWGYVGEINNLFKDHEILSDPDRINCYESVGNELSMGVRMYEHVSIFCATNNVTEWELLYKEVSSDFTRNVLLEGKYGDMSSVENDYAMFINSKPRCENAEVHLGPTCSTPVLYESVTQLIGFDQEEVGKTMGMAPYGKPNEKIPPFLMDNEYLDTNNVVNANLLMNTNLYHELLEFDMDSDFQNRADIAYAVQKALEKKVILIVEKAMSLSDSKKIVLSGGTFHNIIINEILSSKYPDYQFFADPICDDAGHSFGGAMFYWKSCGMRNKFNLQEINPPNRPETMYLGPEYTPEEQLTRIKKWFKKSVNK